MNKPKKLPKFTSYKEEAHFWDTHDITDYIISDKPLNVKYDTKSEKKETLTIRVSPKLKAVVEEMARNYDISTSALVRMWMVDHVKRMGKSEDIGYASLVSDRPSE